MYMENEKDTINSDDHRGKEIDVEELVSLPNEREAKLYFTNARDRLRSVNEWSKIAGNLSADFHLINSNGEPVNRFVVKGDFIRIDIPGPGSQSGDGFDWVQVEEVTSETTEEEDIFSFRVRPTSNPFGSRDEIAHFFSRESTSTFLITRTKNIVIAGIYDQNIKPNHTAEQIVDNVRHQVIGTAGILAFSKLQWTKLAKGILGKNS